MRLATIGSRQSKRASRIVRFWHLVPVCQWWRLEVCLTRIRFGATDARYRVSASPFITNV